jgi:hypothetical protein
MFSYLSKLLKGFFKYSPKKKKSKSASKPKKATHKKPLKKVTKKPHKKVIKKVVKKVHKKKVHKKMKGGHDFSSIGHLGKTVNKINHNVPRK